MSDLIDRLKEQQKNAMKFHGDFLRGGFPREADVYEQDAITLGQAIERIEELEAALKSVLDEAGSYYIGDELRPLFFCETDEFYDARKALNGSEESND